MYEQLHYAKIITDSLSPEGVRLTTMELRYPRSIHAEFMTHGTFERNSASSRAMPVKFLLEMVASTPYVPMEWGKNQKGMQAGLPLDEITSKEADATWLWVRDQVLKGVEHLMDLGVHKGLANRALEPWLWHTVVCTATEWDNFFHQRDHHAADMNIQILARKMKEAMAGSSPEVFARGTDGWHLPYVRGDEEGFSLFGKYASATAFWKDVSVGRCGRISYLNQEGKGPENDAGMTRETLLSGGHMSPFGHVARPMTEAEFAGDFEGSPAKNGLFRLRGDSWCGKFRGWVPYRKEIPYEWDKMGHLEEAAEA